MPLPRTGPYTSDTACPVFVIVLKHTLQKAVICVYNMPCSKISPAGAMDVSMPDLGKFVMNSKTHFNFDQIGIFLRQFDL